MFLQAAGVLLAGALGLRLLGFRRWVTLLSRLTPACDALAVSPANPAASDAALQIARLVAAASRHGLYGGRCLERSVTLWWLLRRRCIPAELRIGVRKQGDRLEAHAWVEHLGRPLNDPQDVERDFLPFRPILPAILEHQG